jgi:hypothetical protein
MSRHSVLVKDKVYVYGFDACIPEYFLMSATKRGTRKFLVGGMSPLAGTAGNLLQEFKRNKLLGIIPPEHIQCVACDMPIPQGETV